MTRTVTGFTATNACSADGMVAGSTKLLLAKVSGVRIIMLTPITALGDRISSPRIVNAQPMPNAKTNRSATAATSPTAHPARVRLELASRCVGEVEGVRLLVSTSTGRRPTEPVQPRDQDQVLAAGQVLVHRREPPGKTDAGAHGTRFRDDVVAQHAGAAAVRPDQRGEHADDGGLAGTVQAQQPVDRAVRHSKVDAVDGVSLRSPLHPRPLAEPATVPAATDGDRESSACVGKAAARHGAGLA